MSLAKTFSVAFLAALLGAGAALVAYDRFVLAPRLHALGETQRVSLDAARVEARDIASELDASVARSVDGAQAAMDAQAAEVERRRQADAAAAEAQLALARSRAQAAEVLSRGQMVKASVAEYYLSTGEWPRSLDQVGLGRPEQHAGGALAGIDLEAGGVIVLRVRDDVARGAQVRLVPSANDFGQIEWRCRARDYPALEDSGNCRG